MSAWLRQHRQALGSALRRLGFLNALVIGVALSLPAAGYAVLENVRGLAGRFALESQISLFLAPGASRSEVEALGKTLRADRRIVKLNFVPREQALLELTSVPGMPEVIAALGHNPLPDAFVLTAGRDMVEGLTADLARLPGVAHVQADAAWARRLGALASLGRLAIGLLSALLAMGLVAVTFNTIRLQILTQRAEIEVSKLIGATDAFIRRPFYYVGLLQGIVGGLVALAVAWGALALLNREVTVLAASYGSAFAFRFLSAADASAVVAFAGCLGWLGAQLSVSRHLRQIEPA